MVMEMYDFDFSYIIENYDWDTVGIADIKKISSY